MAFDVEGARKAGYSEEEIAQYLEGKGGSTTPKFDVTANKFDVKAAMDAGYTEQEIADHLAKNHKQAIVPSAPQSQPSLYQQALRKVSMGASGFNRGVANTVGLPVDLLNSALGMMGLGSSQPVGGSAWLNRGRQAITGQDVKPQGFTENLINAIPEQIGGMLPMFATGGTLPLLKTALGAGAGSGVARSISDNPYVDMAAQIMGGSTPNIVKGVVRTMPNMEHSMMERATKYPTTLKPEVRYRNIETQLNEGITPYPKGLEKSNKIIADINTEVQGRINQFHNQGKTVPMGTDLLGRRGVLDPSIEYAQKTIPKEAFPTKPTNQIADTITEFATGKPENIAIRDAQNYKQSINAELNDFYKALGSSPDKATLMSRKWTMKTKEKIANGLREQIAEVFPEITSMNKRESALLELNKSLYREVNRIAQHDLLSLRTAIAAVVNPKYGIMTYLLDNPRIQSNLAVILRKARNAPINQQGLVGQAMVQAGNISRNQGGN